MSKETRVYVREMPHPYGQPPENYDVYYPQYLNTYLPQGEIGWHWACYEDRPPGFVPSGEWIHASVPADNLGQVLGNLRRAYMKARTVVSEIKVYDLREFRPTPRARKK